MLAAGLPCARPLPNITRLGTWDLGIVETTPVVVQGRLLLYVNSAEQPCSDANGGCTPRADKQIGNSRFIDVLTGETVGEPFGAGEGLGSALYEPETGLMHVFATLCQPPPFIKGKSCTVQVYSSPAATLSNWTRTTAIDAADKWNAKHNTTLWNTSVGKGKVNGTGMYVMAFETDLDYWTTRFAVAPSPTGPWSVLDVESVYISDPTLETANPTLRYNSVDGYWYCFTGRKSPDAWFFFMELFRAREITGPWLPAPGMGNKSAVGIPMLAPTTAAEVAADRSLVPQAWKRDKARYDFVSSLQPWWESSDDVNNSDLDLVEYNNTDPTLGPTGPMVVMTYCWGSQHSNNGLGLAISPGVTLDQFMSSFF